MNETQLRPSKRRVFDRQLFRNAFNASPIGIVVEDLQGQPLFANPAFCAFLGFSQKELRNKHCVDFSPPEDAGKDWALFQQLREGLIDHYQIEKRYYRKDGSLVWGNLTISLLNSSPSSLVIAMVEDITEKRKAEEARFRHAAVIESTDDAIASGTLDGIIVSWNTGAQKMYGYTEAEAVGKPISMLVPPELPGEENRILETLKAGGRIEHFETVRATKTGKRIDVSLSISPIKDSLGKIVGISGIARDITERKRAEQRLRESEQRFLLAAQAGKMYIYEWDVATDVVVRSGEVAAVVGGEASVLTREQVLARVHPDDRELFASSVTERTPDNPDTQISYRVLEADGSVKWRGKTARAYFDRDGRMLRMVGIVADITQYMLGEEKLREYQRAVEGAEEFISVFDREYRCIMSNRAYLSRKKLAREQVVGHFARELVNEGTYETVIKPKMDECFQGKVVRYELRLTYPEIGERDLLAAYYPIEGWNGVDRIVCVLHDITDRKRTERALADMNQKLIEAQEKERARIARELHDDINQRLAMLSIELQQLQDHPTEIEKRVEALRKRTAEISYDVQALSHDLHPSKLEYLGVVAAVRSWCKEFGESQQIQINFKAEIRSAVPFEIGITLFRILQEALHNATKHSGVKRVVVQLSQQRNEIQLTISDEGKGFDVEEARQGRGLGLASMEERVRLVNGTMAIESKPMSGTTIRVHVPLASQPIPQRRAV